MAGRAGSAGKRDDTQVARRPLQLGSMELNNKVKNILFKLLAI
jgi:hypothetical protein